MQTRISHAGIRAGEIISLMSLWLTRRPFARLPQIA
jgi:hypothetical protein